ncbi:TIGR01457 family HAD-type hydrolase [Listeria ilorinensis]|uniref:TIGR01457 family HAD-type hydrolase n=1 Tax=Listeria ilorinensis TaxID=2867439 RepID=UPI001EF4A6F5|nr:TIGR01457 family HAD-type hydrolase [Listeria ilorinensis]
MRDYQAYLIDLDGTMYRGNAVIPEAIGFIRRLNKKKIPYLFVTNNSTTTPEKVADKLVGMGIETTADRVFTSSQATALYMQSKSDERSVYAIGEAGLFEALDESGFYQQVENPAFVVVGLDRELTYEKLAAASLAIRSGATFISTNADAAIPTEAGLLPGNGSLTALLSVATETEPTFIGKPEAIIMEQAIAKLGAQKEDVIMVGDNYETDILAGIHFGIDTVIVHTGFTSQEALQTKKIQPTHSINTLDDWVL